MDLSNIALKYSENGFSVIPVTTRKTPTLRDWKKFQDRPMTSEEVKFHFQDAYGIALLMGTQKALYTLDIDLKYDLSGDVYERFLSLIPQSILNKLYIQKTQSGGYHMIFTCPYIQEGNLKLASRLTTADEKHKTYMEAFSNPLTKDKALKIATNDKVRVIFETRGYGGYILINPTPGYEKVSGSKFEELSLDEYHELLDSAREFNELTRIERIDSRQQHNDDTWEISPFKDFNSRGDGLFLLYQNGWRNVKETGSEVRLKRPGKSSASSAIYNKDRQLLSVFSTSTSFDNNRAYTNSDILIHLEFNDDIGAAYKYLVDKKFGVEKK